MNCTTAEGIEAYTKDLKGLHQLAKDRAAAAKEGQRLSEFIVLGRLYLDAHGQVRDCKFEWGYKPFPGFVETMAPVVPAEYLKAFGKLSTSIYFTRTIPAPDAICAECGYGWDISNWFDTNRQRTDYDNDEVIYRHSVCATLARDREYLKEYVACVERAGLGDMLMSSTPSEYHADDAPWVLLHTPKGIIKFGWRKRVINIDWSDIVTKLCAPLDPYGKEARAIKDRFDGRSLFHGEDVTKDLTIVHAWGKDKLVEYLEVLSKEMGIGKFRPRKS